jgi:hypothetical protein
MSKQQECCASAANDSAEKRAYVVLVSRAGVQIARYEGLFADESEACMHGMEFADNNGKVTSYPVVERSEAEGRRSYKAGRALHLKASPAALQGWLQAKRNEDTLRGTADAERLIARALFGDSPLFS